MYDRSLHLESAALNSSYSILLPLLGSWPVFHPLFHPIVSAAWIIIGLFFFFFIF
jgi:hypothetical protein